MSNNYTTNNSRPPSRRRNGNRSFGQRKPLPNLRPAFIQPKPPVPDHLEGAFNSLIPDLKRAVAASGYVTPTPIQEQAIPHLIAGRDLLGCAQTGTGKTAAFTLPILQYLDENRRKSVKGLPRVLIVTPTRELSAQIGESIRDYGKFLKIRHTVIFGGVGQHPQVSSLSRGVDIVVATPGRLLDLMQQGHLSLEEVEVFVLDEADRMLDMGFLPDVRRIIAKLPAQRQTLFFSATLLPDVVSLARTLVKDPVHITIEPEKPTVECIVQKVYFVNTSSKINLLIMLLEDESLDRVIVFTRMKHRANQVAKKLVSAGISATAIHGNKSQTARTNALASFKTGQVRVMVATDIAARGIDVDSISHVINYDLPNEPETYVHRIGRTARAGAEGDAISFCAADERPYLKSIERLIHSSIPRVLDHRYHSGEALAGLTSGPGKESSQRGRNSGFSGGRNRFSRPRRR